MGYEDLTTYTQVDPSDKVTVTPAKVLATDIRGQEAQTRVFKDFGADYFSSLDIILTGCEVSHDAGSGLYDNFAVTNSVLTDSYNGAGADDLLVGINDDGGGGIHPRIILVRGAFADYATYNPQVATGQVYYFRLIRSVHGTTASLFIYSDATLKTLLETLVVSGLDANRTWRYIMPLTHRVNGVPAKHTIYYENISLSGPVPEPTTNVSPGFRAGVAYPFARTKNWR